MEKPIHRIGLTELYKPNDIASHEFDVVLVHGLFGHPQNTWTSRVACGSSPPSSKRHDISTSETIDASEEPPRKRIRNGKKELFRDVFWPRDLLPIVVPRARILTWGYDVQIEQMLNSTSQASLYQHAETLLTDLTTIRVLEADRTKPLIFVAHSLGGIVVKDALCQSRNEQTIYKEILSATRGVLFLGTPHQGSRVATLGRIACEISKLFIQKPNTSVLRGIEVNSEILERITRSFGQILDTSQLQIHSFREELDTCGVRIVDSFSSAMNHSKETRGMLYANHRDMAKFSSIEDVKFKRVVSVIERWIQMDSSNNMETSYSNEKVAKLPDCNITQAKYEECLESLNNTMARSRVETVETPYIQTYEWLFDPKIGFTDWLTGRQPDTRFWIQGKPASGKSTIMKFAMNHTSTRTLLQRYDHHPWIIAGYFFHDRGSELVQKSALGFLREILYQILRQQPDYLSLIYELFNQLLESLPKDLEAKRRRQFLANSWTISTIEQALSSMKANGARNVNLFLAVDALDEHEGNHRELLSILNRLALSDGHPRFRLRLCLAGRPENVFKDALQSCPGFAIHEHTSKDIRTYTLARIDKETGSRLTDDGKQDLLRLVETIVNKAHGVFLWVRLVVNEIIEGLCEGDTIAELEDLLSTIPTELEELYTRALSRSRYTSRRDQRNSPEEKRQAYVMFQIIISCINSFQLATLLVAVNFLTTEIGLKSCFAQVQRLSKDQMQRRLNSRSAGLLEAPRDRVQFMHQTVKEYMMTGKGARVISQEIRPDHRQSGHLMLSRFLLSFLGENVLPPIDDNYCLEDRRIRDFLKNINYSEDPDAEFAGYRNDISDSKDSDDGSPGAAIDSDDGSPGAATDSDDGSAGVTTESADFVANVLDMFRSLSHYLRVVEIQERTCIKGFLEPTTLKASEGICRIVFEEIVNFGSSLVPARVHVWRHEYWRDQILLRNDRPEIQLLLYYVLAGLHLSFKESILLHRNELRREDIRCLHQAALKANPESNVASSMTEDWREYIPEMPPSRTRTKSKTVHGTSL